MVLKTKKCFTITSILIIILLSAAAPCFAGVAEKTIRISPQWIKALLLMAGVLLVCLFAAFVISKRLIKRQIDELKMKNQKIKESRDEYRQLFDESPVSIILFDDKGIVTFVNKWHLKIFAKNRYDRNFFVGKIYWSFSGLSAQVWDIKWKDFFMAKQ